MVAVLAPSAAVGTRLATISGGITRNLIRLINRPPRRPRDLHSPLVSSVLTTRHASRVSALLAPDGADRQDGTAAGSVPLDAHLGEPGARAVAREHLGLLVRPSVTRVAGGSRTCPPFDAEEPPAARE